MKKPKSRPTLGDLKQHLTCNLCSGYLTEAATINKCLHSFCHPCIVRHLATSNSCPTCGRVLHPRRPLSKIRRDRTLQRLVYKTVPGLLKRTEASDNSKEPDLELLSDPLFPTNDFFSICLEQKSRRSEIGPLTRILDSLLSFVVDDIKIEEPRYLFCAAIMKLKILKKFLCFKFDLSPRYEIGMMCCNELFDDDCTLLDVAYISRWTVAEPLKLQYLIMDKEKLLAAQVEESTDPVLDVLPQDQPSIDDLPSSVSSTPVDPSISTIQDPPEPDDDPHEEKTSAIVTTEPDTLVPPITPAKPRKVQGSSSAKKKRGRKQRPTDSFKTVSDDIPYLEKNIVDSIDPDKSTTPATHTEAPPSIADHRSPKKQRGRKRKSESSGLLVASSVDEKNDELHSKKRAERLSSGSAEDIVSADISNCNEDTPVMKKPKAGAANDQPPSVPDSAVPQQHQSPDDGEKQPSKTDAVSNTCDTRIIGTLKISLDGQHIVRNVTSPKDNTNLRVDEDKKGHSDEKLTKGQYRLKRKDDLRLQLSRKTKPTRSQDEEDISQEKTEVATVDRKKTLRAKKTAPQKTKTRPEASKVQASDILERDHLTVTPRPLDKKCARVVQKVSSPPGDYDSPEPELYIRSPIIRKKRSPSITETPSPVVYDRDIETSPFLMKRGNDKKSSRFFGRKSVIGKIPRAVSISTIPPTTFVLAAERKQGSQSSGDKMMDDVGEPMSSLKVVLRMVDDRKQSVAHDRTDDCFTVSSTVADDEAELAGAGSGNSLDESPESHGISESRAALDAKRTVPVSSEPTRLQPPTVLEIPPFVHMVSDLPPSVTPNKNLIPNDAVRPLPGVGCSDGELLQGTKPLVPPTGTVLTGKVDRGAKRKRLESVISSLKPVAAVMVSTDPVQPAPSRQPSIPNNVAVVPWDSSTSRSKFTPPTGFARAPGKPRDTAPSLLHRLVSSREPLNIPVPTLRHQWQPPRGAVYPPVRFPPNSHYQVRPQGLPPPREPPRNNQRQHHPRGGPRGRGPTGRQQQHQQQQNQARFAMHYPSTSNAHIAAAAYAMGLLQAQRQTRPPPPQPPPHSVYHRGWTPDQDRMRFFAAGAASAMRSSGVVRSRPPLEPNGYDAPLELTTKKSRDVSA